MHACGGAPVVERAVARALQHSKRLRTATNGEAPRVSVQIASCQAQVVRKRKVTSQGGPISGPTGGGGVASGSEEEVSFQQESTMTAALEGRVEAGTRSLPVSTAGKSRSLDDAADDFRRALDAALKELGPWLLAP